MCSSDLSANNNDLGVIVTNSYDKIDLNEPTTAITADELIQNELSGDVVRGIRRTATAGTGSALFIRGLNSINVNAQPLYVVDGVIWNSLYSAPSIYSGYYSSPLVDIDVNDIEDITVLKDGTSLYGSKGANGVILINTKRGKNMTTTIDVNAYFGWNSKPKSTPMMKASEYKTYLSEVLGTVDGLSASTIEKMPWFDEDQSRNYYKDRKSVV